MNANKQQLFKIAYYIFKNENTWEMIETASQISDLLIDLQFQHLETILNDGENSHQNDHT